MKEIYLLSQGDSINKIKHEYHAEKLLSKSKDKLFGFDYVELNNGIDDIYVVRNYYPYIVYNAQNTDTIIDIMSRGFDCGGVNSIGEGDKLIIYKPKSIRYVVKPLENIDNIANKFGIKKENIIETNALKTEKLFVGQILWI